MINLPYKYLKIVEFKNWQNWDVKSYVEDNISSQYPIIQLKNVLKEVNIKEKLKEKPEEEFGILGVNNKIGIFDAYLEKGSKINQPYKVIENNQIAYNPYRVNVGSVGIKSSEQSYKYISNAYVVFGCDENQLDANFFLRLFKSDTFNKLVQNNTKGSVRQNLSFDLLSKMRIPLPDKDIQKKLLEDYDSKFAKKEVNKIEIKSLEVKIENYLMEELGIKIVEKNKQENGYKFLQFVDFKKLSRWDTDYFLNKGFDIFEQLKNSKFELKLFGDTYKQKKQRFNKNKHESEFFNYIEMGSINDNADVVETNLVKVSEAPSRATQIVSIGDYIIGTTRPYLKKFTFISDKYDKNICSSAFYIVKQDASYNLEFLDYVLKSAIGVKQFEFFMTGGLYPAITSGELQKVQIPLPPLEIQNKIVNQIDIWKSEIKRLKQEAEELERLAKQEFEDAIFN